MALTYANQKTIYRGSHTVIIVDATWDNSYAAGGEVINASDVGLVTINVVIPTATAGYNAVYSKTNDASGKLAIYPTINPSTNSATATPVDASAGRDLSTVVATLFIVGR